MSVALLSHVAPATPSGQGVMLGRLLPGFPRPPLIIVSPRGAPVPSGMTPLPPDVPHHAGNLLLPLAVMRRAHRIARLVRAHRCRALVACSGDLVDLPAGRIAAHLAGIPFIAWLFDPYAGHWPGRAMNLFAALAERLALAGAAAAIVPNLFARRLYERRYRLPVAVVPNPLPDAYPFDYPAPVDTGSIRYTGAVYRVNGNGLVQLAAALSPRAARGMTLEVYASRDRRYLDVLRARPGVRVHPAVEADQALTLQRSAELLYLPLGRRREMCSATWRAEAPPPSLLDTAAARSLLTCTAAPAKLGEYLASGRPVLARVPRGSYIAWYLRRHRAGVVVDTPGEDDLAAALRYLRDGGPQVDAMTANARRAAVRDFAPESARAALAAVLAKVL